MANTAVQQGALIVCIYFFLLAFRLVLYTNVYTQTPLSLYINRQRERDTAIQSPSTRDGVPSSHSSRFYSPDKKKKIYNFAASTIMITVRVSVFTLPLIFQLQIGLLKLKENMSRTVMQVISSWTWRGWSSRRCFMFSPLFIYLFNGLGGFGWSEEDGGLLEMTDKKREGQRYSRLLQEYRNFPIERDR